MAMTTLLIYHSKKVKKPCPILDRAYYKSNSTSTPNDLRYASCSTVKDGEINFRCASIKDRRSVSANLRSVSALSTAPGVGQSGMVQLSAHMALVDQSSS